ncbi:hypothetical protein T4B_6103 [Trichinella pseudospiralis]|uniref:Uncharacterized protein n=1 Tax=Trichinella pseudospiralis TaxID=6337 RepID=A0A0V1ITS7_TRIPS|nr:hypothetical protein T4B_6103 [Trichinella pseudospiralis]
MRIQKLQFSNVEKWIKRNKQDKQLQFDGSSFLISNSVSVDRFSAATPTKSVRCLLDSWIDNGDSGGALSRPITTSDKQQFVIILNIG